MATYTSFCEQCDTRNPDDAHFCVMCGAPLAIAAATSTPVRPSPAPTTYAPQYAPAAPMYGQGYGIAPAPALAGGQFVQHAYVHQGAPVATMQPPLVNLLVRAIWFLFVGVWLGQMWLVVAWLFNLTLVGMPLGIWMLNKMPQVMTLRPNQQPVYVQGHGMYMQRQQTGAPFVVRAVYFVLIGWWVSFLWLQFAWLFAASVIGLPLAFLMFERTATIATLGE